jgi:hypothetical protein
VTILDPAAKLEPQHRGRPSPFERPEDPRRVVFGEQVDARAREERGVDVRDRRIAGTLVRAAALVDDAPRVGRHGRRQQLDELGERQLANLVAERRDLVAGRAPLDD